MPRGLLRAAAGTAATLLGVLTLATAAAAERLPIRIYSVADGLPHNVINRIVRDSRGFLWFCTDDGLSLFDGYRFSNFGVADGLPHSAVRDLLETREGEYWVATAGGVSRFNPRGEPRFATVTSPIADQSARNATASREPSDQRQRRRRHLGPSWAVGGSRPGDAVGCLEVARKAGGEMATLGADKALKKSTTAG